MPRRLLPLVLLLVWIFNPLPVSAQEATPTPEALTPEPVGNGFSVSGTPAAGAFIFPENGASLSGQVNLIANAASAWRLDFAYAGDQTGAWFPLAASTEPVSAGTLTVWDTTALTDGFYILRLRVFAADGSLLDQARLNVRLRNYSPFETATPTQTLTPTVTSTPTPFPEATLTATLTPAASPTLPGPLPPNPAELNLQDILLYFGKGVLAVVAVFGFAGLAWSLRRK